jgi:hypothetical protein
MVINQADARLPELAVFRPNIWPLSDVEPMRGREISGGCGIATLADIAEYFGRDPEVFNQDYFRLKLGIEYEEGHSPDEVKKINESIADDSEKIHVELKGTSHAHMEKGVRLLGLKGRWEEYKSLQDLVEKAEEAGAKSEEGEAYVVVNIMTGPKKLEDGHYARFLGVDSKGFAWTSDPEFDGSVRKVKASIFEKNWFDYGTQEGKRVKFVKNAMIVT